MKTQCIYSAIDKINIVMNDYALMTLNVIDFKCE